MKMCAKDTAKRPLDTARVQRLAKRHTLLMRGSVTISLTVEKYKSRFRSITLSSQPHIRAGRSGIVVWSLRGLDVHI